MHESATGFEFEAQHVASCIRDGKLESDIMPMADSIACSDLFDLLDPLIHTKN